MDSKKIIKYALIIIVFLILIGTIIWIIKSNGKAPTSSKIEYAKIGEDYELKQGKKIYLSDEKRTSIKYIAAVDSRCPKDAECIWEGEIEYTMEYKNKEKSEKFYLGTVKNKEYKIKKSVEETILFKKI